MAAWLARIFRRRAISAPPGHALLGPVETDATRAPLVLEPAEESVAAVIETAVAPEPVPVGDGLPQQSDTAVMQPEIPLALTPEYRRERSLYFAAGRYGVADVTVPQLLAPDVAFRAGRAARAVPMQVRAQEPAVPLVIKAERVPTPDLPLSRFVSPSKPPPVAVSGAAASLDPILFSTFVLWPEGAAEVPNGATDAYLAKPELAASGRKLRDLVVRNWSEGGAPLTPSSYFTLASTVNPHAGTAMLLCHNVAKTFARGGRIIEWQNRNRTRGEYSDGAHNFSASVVHRQGLVRPNALAPPSLFYLLFSARALGVVDPGDWYRYFSTATLAAYVLASAVTFSSQSAGAVNEFTRRLDGIASLIAGTGTTENPAHSAWLWANTVAFADWGTWGRIQARAISGARLGIKAIRFAFKHAQVTEPDNLRWSVPNVGALLKKEINAESIGDVLAANEVHEG
jgi:hypothetical protein